MLVFLWEKNSIRFLATVDCKYPGGKMEIILLWKFFFKKYFKLTPGHLHEFRRYQQVVNDARSEGASVHEKRQKKVWFFRPIDVFNLGFFRSDDLVIWIFYGVLAWKNYHFFLHLMVFRKYSSLFEKDHCTKKTHFFLPENRRTFRPSVTCTFRKSTCTFGKMVWNSSRQVFQKKK